MALSPDGTRLAVVGAQGLWMVGPDMSPTLVTPTTSSEAGYDFFESPQWRPNGHELIFLSSSLAMALETGVFVVQTDGSGLRALVQPDDRGSGAARPVTGRDQGRLFQPGDRSARDPRRRRSNRARPPRRLRWSRRRCATAMVARWHEARLRTHSGRGIPVDGRVRQRWPGHRDRSDKACQVRWCRGPVLAGWNEDPGVLQRRPDHLGPRSHRRSRHEARLRRDHAPDLAGSRALTTPRPSPRRPTHPMAVGRRHVRYRQDEAAGARPRAILGERGHLSRATA